MKNTLVAIVSFLTTACGALENKDTQKVCLTIDDHITTGMLETLKEKNVPVAFFPIASKVDQETLAQAKEDGHVIGNHSYTHPNLKTLSFEEQQKEIELADEALGVETVVLRPPFGEYNANTMKLGKRVITWDMNADTENIKKGGIVLLHEESRLETVILDARKNGMEFYPIGECL